MGLLTSSEHHLHNVYKKLRVHTLEELRERYRENNMAASAIHTATLSLFHTTSKRLQTLGVGFDEQARKISLKRNKPLEDIQQHLSSIGLSEFKRNEEEVDIYMDFLCQQYPHLPKS